MVIDAGGLSAFDRGDRAVVTLVARAVERAHMLVVPAGVVGQVWRDGAGQASLARLLSSPQVSVEPLDGRRAREAGQLCGVRGTRDVIDATVVLAARRHGGVVLTSDPDDLLRLDPSVVCHRC